MFENMDSRKLAAIKLAVYGFGFLIFFIYSGIASSKSNRRPPIDKNSSSSSSSSSSSQKNLSLSEMKALVMYRDYTILSQITIGETKYIIIQMQRGNMTTGLYSINNEPGISYSIKNDEVYDTSGKEETLNSELFKDIETKYLNPRQLIELIDTKEPLIKEEGKEKLYTYDLDNVNIIIKTENRFKEIDISYKINDVEYRYFTTID